MPEPALAQRELGSEIREHELYALELDDAPPRLAPLVDIGDRIFEGGSRDAKRVRGDAGARLVERGEQDGQARAWRADQVRARHAAVVERQRRCTRGAQPELVFGAQHRQAGRALFHHQRGDRSFRVGDFAPLAEHQQQIGDVAAGDEELAAVDQDVLALRFEPGLHAGRIAAGRSFGNRERYQAARRHARQQALLLRLAAIGDHRLDAVESGRPDDAGGGAGLADLAHAGEIGAVGHGRAAVGLGNEHRVQPERVDRLDIVPGKLGRSIVVLGARRELRARQVLHAREQHALLFGQLEARIQAFKDVHRLSPCSCQCAMLCAPSM